VFALLTLIGGKMVFDALKGGERRLAARKKRSITGNS
jgi:putative Mn2+ efflux pump MntP